jgi:hypothetical protein
MVCVLDVVRVQREVWMHKWGLGGAGDMQMMASESSSRRESTKGERQRIGLE